MTPRLTSFMAGILFLCCSLAGRIISASVDHDKSLGQSVVYPTTLTTITTCHPTVVDCAAPLSKLGSESLPDTIASDDLSQSSGPTVDKPTNSRGMKRNPVPFHVSSSLDYTLASSWSSGSSMATSSTDATTTPAKDSTWPAKDSSVIWKDWTASAPDTSLLPSHGFSTLSAEDSSTLPTTETWTLPPKDCSNVPAKDCSTSPLKDSSSSSRDGESQTSPSSRPVTGNSISQNESPSMTSSVSATSSSSSASGVLAPPPSTLSSTGPPPVVQSIPLGSGTVVASTTTRSSQPSSPESTSESPTSSSQSVAGPHQSATSPAASAVSPGSTTVPSSTIKQGTASSASYLTVSPVSSTSTRPSASQGTAPWAPGSSSTTDRNSTTTVSASPGIPPISGRIVGTTLLPNSSILIVSSHLSTSATASISSGISASVSTTTTPPPPPPLTLSSSQASHTFSTSQNTGIPPDSSNASASGSPLPSSNSTTSAVALASSATSLVTGPSASVMSTSLSPGESSSAPLSTSSSTGPVTPSPGPTENVPTPSASDAGGIGVRGPSSIQITSVPTLTFSSTGPISFTISLPGRAPSLWTLTSGAPQSTTCPSLSVSSNETYLTAGMTLFPTMGCNPIYTSFLGLSGSTIMTLTNPVPSFFDIYVVPNLATPTPTLTTLCAPFVTSITRARTTLSGSLVAVEPVDTVTLTPSWGCVGPAAQTLPPCPVQTTSGFPLFFTSPDCQLTATPSSTWNTYFTWATASDGSSSALVEWVATSTAYTTIVNGHTSILPDRGGGGGGWGWKCHGLLCDPRCNTKLCFLPVCTSFDLCTLPTGGCCGGGLPFPPPPPLPPVPPPNCVGSCLPGPDCVGPFCISESPSPEPATGTASTTQSSSTTSSSCSISSVSVCTRPCSTWNITNTATPGTTLTTSCGDVTCSMANGCSATATTTTVTEGVCSMVPFSLDASYSAIWSSILSEVSSGASGFSTTFSRNSSLPPSTSSPSPRASLTPPPPPPSSTSSATPAATSSPPSSTNSPTCSVSITTSTLGPGTVVANTQWSCPPGASDTLPQHISTTPRPTISTSVGSAVLSQESVWSSGDAALSSSEASARTVLSEIHASDSLASSVSVASVAALSAALNPPVLPGVQAKVDTVDCALNPQNHPDPWPTDSQFFWLSAQSAHSAGMCELLHSQNVIVGPPSDNKAIQSTYYQISASEGDAAMYSHNITMAVAWDQAGCSVPSKPSPVDFSTYGVQKCHDAFDVPVTICSPWIIHQRRSTTPPGLYTNYPSIGGVYWQDCLRWMVFSLPQSPDPDYVAVHPPQMVTISLAL